MTTHNATASLEGLMSWLMLMIRPGSDVGRVTHGVGLFEQKAVVGRALRSSPNPFNDGHPQERELINVNLTRTRAFKAAALITVGGVGSTVVTDISGPSSWEGLRAVAPQPVPGKPSPPAGWAPPVPGDENHPSRDTAGPVIGRLGGVTVHDSTKSKPISKHISDVDAGLREIRLEEADDGDAPAGPLVIPEDLAKAATRGGLDGSQSRPTSDMTIQSNDCGAWFSVRGGSLVPPNDGKLVYWNAPGNGWEVRRVLGAECLGDSQNFSFQAQEAFKVSDFNSTFGRRVFHEGGWNFEGCRLLSVPFGISQYECDFKTQDLHRLTPTTSGAFWRTRLRNWATQTAQNQGACAATIIGTWVGTSTLADAGAACIDNGPINPATL